MKTYVLRLTPKDVRDVAVVEARPAAEVVTEGEPVEIRARLRSLGPATTPVAELWIDGVTKGKKQVDLARQRRGRGHVPARSRSTPSVPLHQGYVRLSGSADPAEFDDVRYFTFRVKPATNVLIVSDQADRRRVHRRRASTPTRRTLPPARPGRSTPTGCSTSKFLEKADNLGKRYRVHLPEQRQRPRAERRRVGAAQRVRPRRRRPGHRPRQARPTPSTTAGTIAEQILPATLDAPVALKEPTTFGQVTDLTHPLFSKYPGPSSEVLSQVPVSKYWSVKPHDEGSRVLLAYADKAPALIERVFKGSRTGRVLLWTTPLSRRPDPKSPDAWNEFPNPLAGWSFFYLMNQTVSYLSGTVEEGLSSTPAATWSCRSTRPGGSRTTSCSDPKGKTVEPLSPAGGERLLVIVAPQQLGNWSVTGTGTEGGAEVIGFSVNPPVSETQFVPLETADLDRLFRREGPLRPRRRPRRAWNGHRRSAGSAASCSPGSCS